MLRVPDLETIRSPGAYLLAIANNLVKEDARQGCEDRHTLDVEDPQVEDQLAELPTAMGDIDQEHRVERLREVLDLLFPKCRAAVILQYWHHQG